MAAFDFTVSDPQHGDYYTGTIAATDKAEAKQLLEEKLQDRYEAMKDEDDRVAVDPANSKVEVKARG